MKTQTGANRGRKQEQGIALLIALFALLLLSAIAMGMMYMADTENSVNTNYRDAQAAFYASQAGLQEARLRILNDYSSSNPRSPMGNLPIITPTQMPGNGNAQGVYYIINNTATSNIQPWVDGANNQYRDDELCKEQYPITGGSANVGTAGVPCVSNLLPGGGWFTAANSVMGATGAVNYAWVRVTMKQNQNSQPVPVDGNPNTGVPNDRICWNGTNEVLLSTYPGYATCETIPAVGITGFTTVYTVASLGLTPTGARRMMLAEIALAPPTYANAAVDSQDHVTLNGQLTVNGYDNCSCTQLSTCNNKGASPGSGTQLCTSPPAYTSRPGKTCDPSKYAIFAASTVDNPNSSESIFAPQNPPIAQNQSWPFNIPSMIQQYQQNAINASTSAPYSYNCTPPVVVNGVTTVNGACGTHSGQTFGVPPTFPPSPVDNPVGPANMSPQVTYVPGDLQITAGSVGNGVLIVDGDLDIHGGLQFYGLILVKGVVKFTGGGAQATNIFGAVLAGQESLVDNTLGGSAVIQFDQCALSRRMINNPPIMLVTREVMY